MLKIAPILPPETQRSFNYDYHEQISRRVHEDIRQIYLIGNVSGESVTGTLIELTYLDSIAHAPINLHLNTYGGDVHHGLSLYDSIKQFNETSPVTVLASGVCMSMGVIILQAGEERLSHPHTRFMLHKLSAQDAGSLDDLEDRQKDRQVIQQILNEIVLKKAKITPEELTAMIRRKDFYLTAKEALDIGLIDRIVE